MIDYTTAGQSSHTPSSRASAQTPPSSTVTKAKREGQIIREDFRSSLAQLAQVQTRLAQENNDHEMRADAIMRDMDEMRQGLRKIQAEGRQNQGRLEASMASLNDLIKQRETLADARMAEMSAVMKKRDRQTDERMKLMTDALQRRDMDANVRMVDLMTTMQDLTLGIKAIVSQTAVTQAQAAPRAPPKYQQTDMPSTSAAPQAPTEQWRNLLPSKSSPQSWRHPRLTNATHRNSLRWRKTFTPNRVTRELTHCLTSLHLTHTPSEYLHQENSTLLQGELLHGEF